MLEARAEDPKLSPNAQMLARARLDELGIAEQQGFDFEAARREQEQIDAAKVKEQEEEQRRAAEEKRERDKALLQELLRRSKESQATTPTEDRETGPFNLQLTKQLENALTQLQRREAFERAEREAAAKKEEEIRKAEAQRGAQEHIS